MAKSFAAQIKGITDLTKKSLRYVATQSIQDVVSAAQTPQQGFGQGATSFVEGKIPVDTSELINGLTSEGATGPDSYAVAITGMEIGDVLRFSWTAPHAMPMELGFTAKNGTQVPGRHFAGANAARFSEFVEKRVKEVRT